MTRSNSGITPRRRARRIVSLTLLACGITVAATAGAAVSSTFDTDADGWVGISCPNPGLVCGTTLLGPGEFAWQATGGSSGASPLGPQADGYIKSTDPDSGNAARIFAPAKFNDALTLNGRLMFDLTIIPDVSTDIEVIPPPILSIAGAGRLLVYVGATPGFNSWTSYDVLLNNTGNTPGSTDSWVGFAGAAGPVPVTEADFLAVFADPGVLLSITGEFINDGVNEFDMVGLDNVHLVPLPAALPLFAAALCGVGFARRRRTPA